MLRAAVLRVVGAFVQWHCGFPAASEGHRELPSSPIGHRPNVLVVDLKMPGGSTLEAIPELRRTFPDPQIVVLTMQDEPAYARQALNAGALRFVR
jgi:DNA-binding NarL/FixJ family response regulator